MGRPLPQENESVQDSNTDSTNDSATTIATTNDSGHDSNNNNTSNRSNSKPVSESTPPTTPSSSSTALPPINNKTQLLVLSDLIPFIPLRLSPEERALLTVLENTLHVSEYTDHVDVAAAGASYRRHNSGQKARRILDGILEACHIATGLAVGTGQDQMLKSCCQTTPTTNTTKNGKLHNDHDSDHDHDFDHDHDHDHGFKKRKGKGKDIKKKKNNANLLKKTITKNKNKNKKKLKAAFGNSKTTGIRMPHTTQPSPLPNGMKYVASRSPKENALLFQTIFEIGRRNKVLNPSSMRTTYGKLMYLLQDAQSPTVAKSLGFSLHKDLVLVGGYLQQHQCDDLIHDKRLLLATQFVSDKDMSTGQKYDRHHVQQRIQQKRQTIEQLVEEYAQKSLLDQDNIRRAIESISDAIAYIESNVSPVEAMLGYLQDNFNPNNPNTKGAAGGPSDFSSLELRGNSRYYSSSSSSYSRYGLSAFSSSSSGGNNNSSGPTLSHSHPTQYTFVWQSLHLWCKVQRHMHKLWVCADLDLLSTTTSYHLYNTGQGLNRVQQCPKVARVMRNLLHQTQQEAKSSWVGLSVIHLGDRDVPNALVFIDKYTQIPRFLNPIVSFLRSLPELYHGDPIMKQYIDNEFGSAERLKMLVLCDYFKHGFDGSGDDGGSCIDGRLTSSWNWTSRIAKKKYYHAFMLSGFQGFDGDFK